LSDWNRDDVRDEGRFGAEALGFELLADFPERDFDAAKSRVYDKGRLRRCDDDYDDNEAETDESAR